MSNVDPMTKVFDVLKMRSCERIHPNPVLEDDLMNVYDQQKGKRARGVKLAMVGLVGLLATGAVAEAATGVFRSMIQRVTLDTGNGPQPVTDYVAKENADGSVTVTVGLPEGQESGVVTVEATGK